MGGVALGVAVKVAVAGGAGHGLPLSNWHVEEQQSPSSVLPSSHSSPAWTTSFPQGGPIRKLGANMNAETVCVGHASDAPNARRLVCTAVKRAASEMLSSELNAGV